MSLVALRRWGEGSQRQDGRVDIRWKRVVAGELGGLGGPSGVREVGYHIGEGSHEEGSPLNHHCRQTLLEKPAGGGVE
jgi:hypothetical protein